MTGKRKRKRPGQANEGDQKRQKIIGGYNGREPIVKGALLLQYYPKVSSLREYLLANLPSASKIRRKKISTVGCKLGDKESDRKLAKFLDHTLIGVNENGDFQRDEKVKQLTSFSQKADESISFANLTTVGIYSQSEIVDFCIFLMFSKNQKANGKVQHLLGQGFQRDATVRHMNRGEQAISNVPGVVSVHPNHHVTSMKSWPWPQVLGLFGKQGELMMVDLVLDCGIFVPVDNAYGSFYQLSGQPLGELRIIEQVKDILQRANDKPHDKLRGKLNAELAPKTQEPLNLNCKLDKREDVDEKRAKAPSNINFVRSRVMYARASTNKSGEVYFGFKDNHLLNRLRRRLLKITSSQGQDAIQNAQDSCNVEVLMYIFPRQFGLHNVFTDEVDSKQTQQPFQDYTLRIDEIEMKFGPNTTPKIPRRLRGKAVQLARQLQVSHRRCSYKMLLDHYCPASRRGFMPPVPPQSTNGASDFRTQLSAKTPGTMNPAATSMPPRKSSMLDYATPTAMVSAFCRSVLNHLIPLGFWGSGEAAKQNQKVVNQNVDALVNLQRFAKFSLHHVTQGLKISEISWLGPTNVKLSQSDTQKRWELFHEFLYYVFDSLLSPLIRANFHVTESNIHGSRLFYFRHDVWRTLAEPAMTHLKSTMFEEIKRDEALQILESRNLGYSQVRLVPKESGVRPIMNLRRRQPKAGYSNHLSSSINSVLAPVFNVLTLERSLFPERLGCTMFSTGDLYQRLKTFKSQLTSTESLFFAKVDVTAAFDTIPQAAVIKLLLDIPSESEYRISKHVQIKPSDTYHETGQGKPIPQWKALAKPLDDFDTFEEDLESSIGVGKKHTIFVENVVSTFKTKEDILSLLTEHIQRNMVKVGKKFYRQKEGIPQGSVVSSLLCNYFYADLEAKHLSFLQGKDTLLLRLIDDFLLITTNRKHAKQFLQTMHDGLPEYGVKVNPDKTLVNFEAMINDKKVPRMVDQRTFPYCGSFIDTGTLDITRDRDRRKNKAIVDSLTVEFSKTPGRMFHRKMLNTFKLQAHAMFLDTSFNSMKTVLSNVFSAFIESATKMWTYAKYLPLGKQPGTKLLLKTINDLIELAFVLMKGKGKNKRNVGYKCALSKVQVEWLAMSAFSKVLKKRQSKYGKVLEWIEEKMKGLRGKEVEMCMRMDGVVRMIGGSD